MPRPSKMPPAATTGTRSPTASTTWGTRAMVATWPVWPPASVPWATTMSQPASTAATAWRTLPHMLTTRTLWSWQRSIASRGTPRPATKTWAPSSTMCCTPSVRSPEAVSRSTPKGRSVAAFTARISSHHVLDRHGRGPEATEAAGLRDRRSQGGVGHATHPRQHHAGTRRPGSRSVGCACAHCTSRAVTGGTPEAEDARTSPHLGGRCGDVIGSGYPWLSRPEISPTPSPYGWSVSGECRGGEGRGTTLRPVVTAQGAQAPSPTGECRSHLDGVASQARG